MLSVYRDTLPLLLDDDAISLRRCQQKPPPFEVSFSLAQLVDFLFFIMVAKLYVPSTLNIDLILWHTQLIVCAENVKSWFKLGLV